MEIIISLLKKYVGQNGNDTEDEHSLVLNENPQAMDYYLPEAFTGGGCNVSDPRNRTGHQNQQRITEIGRKTLKRTI